MKVLIETRMNSLKLNESKTPKKGCLGRLEGVCADFKNPTRNGRLYPLGLWKKVFDDELVKEALKTRTLFGELDHPETRFEPLLSEACVVMTDYTIDEDKGLIYGGFDILDTPKGRILKSIVDGGSVVGVSSRGQGDIIESADGERVDEDSYDFACFDVVGTPAVEKARQSVMESVKRIKDLSFKESITKQIDDAETVADLNIIRSVVRSSDINGSEMDTIIESIENKCNKIQNTDKTIVVEEKEQPKTLKESAKTIRDNKKLYSCIKSLRSQVSAYKHRESRYLEVISKNENTIDELKENISTMRKRMIESRKTHAQDKKNLSENASRKFTRLNNDLCESNRSLISEQRENELLREKLQEMKTSSKRLIMDKDTELSKLQEQLKQANERIDYFERNEQLQENNHVQEVRSLDAEVSEYNALLQEAQDKLNSKTETIKSLNESVSRLSEDVETQKKYNTMLEKQLKAFQKQYIGKVSSINGVDSKVIYESVNNKTTPEDVDNLVEKVRDKMDRYNKFPIATEWMASTSNIVVEGTTSMNTEEQKEDSRLYEFILNATKSI